uniref:Uncharacterized protein n=1 Tax=Chromera velia CCMP2878 TaxID=1169474 RepID=A0A0G4HCX6_9ALVE|eukprot:Cvel_6385.t1-p1 / transcript=Cvel_6385.t1 / gene=Cvel_6385 / organism=Chromera_velia_CCMP2878 / gene_product=hypothetical protein / transcript_product=hypothetical protein / location=Cvel_scaffold311:26514-30551(+) / protein_length=565 / sequence_SO=supercontig / SO=protein_coding / is_pseudo=false
MVARIKDGRAKIFALSYGWHSKEHPDPTGITAKTVTQGIETVKDAFHGQYTVMRSLIKGGRNEGESLFSDERGGRREKREGEEDEESWMEKYFVRTSMKSLPYQFPLYFQDFTSLPQWPRTDEEDVQFKKGLGLLPCLYGNSNTNVWFLRCTEVPAGLDGVTNKTPYHKRCWTNFESRVASAKDEKYVAHVGPLLEGFAQLPLSPPAFQWKLEEKRDEERSESNKEGFVVRFTNGLEDRPLVSNLYRTFVLDTQVRGRKRINMEFKYKVDTEEKGKVLGEYLAWVGEQPECEVEAVNLEGLDLNDNSLPPVAASLFQIGGLREVRLGKNKFGPFSLSALKPLRQLKQAPRNSPKKPRPQKQLWELHRDAWRPVRRLTDLFFEGNDARSLIRTPPALKRKKTADGRLQVACGPVSVLLWRGPLLESTSARAAVGGGGAVKRKREKFAPWWLRCDPAAGSQVCLLLLRAAGLAETRSHCLLRACLRPAVGTFPFFVQAPLPQHSLWNPFLSLGTSPVAVVLCRRPLRPVWNGMAASFMGWEWDQLGAFVGSVDLEQAPYVSLCISMY